MNLKKHFKRYVFQYLVGITVIFYIFWHLNYFRFGFLENHHLFPSLVPIDIHDQIRIICLICATIAFGGWIVMFFFLWYKEKRNSSRHAFSRPFIWLLPKQFQLRYRNIPGIIPVLSIISVNFLFSLTIPIMLFVLSGSEPNTFHDEETAQVVEQSDPPSFRKDYFLKDVLFGEGIFFVFVISFIGFWTFYNTLYIKNKGEKAVTELDRMLQLMEQQLKKMIDTKLSCSTFYYILDYSIATGHYSCPEEFQAYRKQLRKLLCKHRVLFLGLVYDRNKLDTRYMHHHSENEQREKWLIDSRDSLIDYLNKEYDDDNTPDKKIVVDICYKPLRANNNARKMDHYIPPEYRKIKHRKEYWMSWKRSSSGVNEEGITQEIERYKNAIGILRNLMANDGSLEEANCNLVLETSEIGLTRLIITRDFVVQFVATEGEKKSRPIGYYSEDLYMIEKYKKSFEDYFKQSLSTEEV